MMGPSSIVNGVRSLFDSDRQHRYQPLASPSAASISDEEDGDNDDDDDDDNDGDSGVGESRRRRTSGGGRRDPGRRAREPLLYSETGGSQRGRRQRGRKTTGVGDDANNDGVLDSVWARGNRRLLKLTLLLMSFGLVLYLGIVVSRIAGSRKHSPPSCDTPDHGYQCYPKVAQYWGQYSPFFSVPSDLASSGDGGSGPAAADPVDSSPFAPPPHSSASFSSSSSSSAEGPLPAGCRFTFAQVLSRHGGRDPTSGKSAAYAALINRVLDTVDRFVDGPDGPFSFFRDYSYRLGADELTRFGELQMVHSGAHFYQRYRSLVLSLAEADASTKTASHIDPFVRSADQHRVVLSAINWVQGFQGARHSDLASHKGDIKKSSSSTPTQNIVLLPEAAGFNNTLSYNGLCKRFSSHAGTEAQRTFAATFVPAITARLNRGLPKANLSDTETIYFMDLCPFETIADNDKGKGGGGDRNGGRSGGGRLLSPFCHLFSETEWRDYDYLQTLGKWYGFGDGCALGATQGVGFVNELVARLTASPVDDHTSTNRTMDADPATFPLDAHVYADFSHDNDMANIFAALGLYNGTTSADGKSGHPSNTTRTEPQDLRGYAASWAVPFAARMYVEKMVCDDDDGDDGKDNEELVRILVNDRVMPLHSCGADQLGRCRLSRFVDSLAFARSGGHWDDCFA